MKAKVWHRVSFWGHYCAFTSAGETETELVGCRPCPKFGKFEIPSVVKKSEAFTTKRKAYLAAAIMFERLAVDTISKADVQAGKFKDMAAKFKEEARESLKPEPVRKQ